MGCNGSHAEAPPSPVASRSEPQLATLLTSKANTKGHVQSGSQQWPQEKIAQHSDQILEVCPEKADQIAKLFCQFDPYGRGSLDKVEMIVLADRDGLTSVGDLLRFSCDMDNDRNISLGEWQAMFATEGAKSQKRLDELLSNFEHMAAVNEADRVWGTALEPRTPTASALMPLELWKDMFAKTASKYRWDGDDAGLPPSCHNKAFFPV